jgi:hypothetical protein
MKHSLVAYSDSENSGNEILEPPMKKRKQVHSSFTAKPSDPICRRLPPLDPKVAVPVPVDDPSKHQGRIRTTPHVDGQFAAYVYAPIFPVQRLQRLLRGIFETIERQVESFHSLVHFNGDEPVDENSPGLRTILPTTMNGAPHLSLTRPMYLRAHQRDILKEAVKEVANKVPKCVYSLVHAPRSGLSTDSAQIQCFFYFLYSP